MDTRPLDDFLQQATGHDGYLGAVALVLQDGKIVYQGVAGHADLARTRPMTEDAIFRIYSMTKPITSVAALVLVEEGRLRLDDPVARYLPEMAGLRRFAGGTAEAPRLEPLVRTLTVRHLLTHTAGFATGGEGREEASRLLEQADPSSAKDLADFAARVARVPLAEEPGTSFRYDGVNTEVLARVVEVASGQSLDAFLRQRILVPLRMRDTGFSVPPSQRARVVDITVMGDDGRLALDDGPSAREPGARLRAYDSGAGGLYSTAADYLRFARMLANGGTLDGVTVLRPDSVDLMMRDQLPLFDPPVPSPIAGEGFGLGGYVVTDAQASARPGSPGQFGWSGAASTYFTIDRQRDIVALLLAQHLPGDGRDELPKLANAFYRRVYLAVAP
ncbi:serine hydrolase domain-containing protein [Pseudoxanthomonas putridarboris]|uniref:Serine hydrolase domain-containing protein n=1 Tax=Pseudoxanthomonas putridarboris TaxID=752605 RepID=A0ABU9IWJ6_9GAMM